MNYKTLDDIPLWGKEVVEKLIALGAITPENGEINLSEKVVQLLVLLEQMGLFEKKIAK